MHRSRVVQRPLPPLADLFGIRSTRQLVRDLGRVLRSQGSGFQLGLSSIGHLRPDLSLPAYAGFVSDDGLAPIMNLFDRVGGGKNFSQRVTRRTSRDFRGGRLTYDEHDGTDLVCPVGTPLCAAAPGTVVLIRDQWLRGGLTMAVDHGAGLVTQYTHCSKALLPIGAVVKRGEPTALSGTSGLDMTAFFPWVPPHVHFMVWVNGRPVHPFLASGEEPHCGSWLHGNEPQPSGPLASDLAAPEISSIDIERLRAVVATCMNDAIREEIRLIEDEPASLAALLEDSLHHDRFAWPAQMHNVSLRSPVSSASSPTLTLPLPSGEYRGVGLSDGEGP